MSREQNIIVISFTGFMNASLRFRKHLINYCISYGFEASETRRMLELLDKVDLLAKSDENFRGGFYRWLTNEYSTTELRELCKQVGYDYWNSLDESGAIDVFDSCSVYIGNG